MKVRKLGGKEEDFSLDKIINAVKKANNSVEKEKRMDDEKINQVVEFVQKKIKNYSTIDVDTIHDFVEKALMNKNQYDIAKSYVLYRSEKKKSKKYSDDELKIISICSSTNEDVSGDNANKRPTFLGTQRDYIAGTKCKTIGRKMLPKEVTKEHDEGSIHFHDMDYSPLQNMSNCCLINDFDMFNNGFAMGTIGIDPSHSFSTACNHLAQIALHVSSSQYGGQSHSWASTLPFLQKSRETISKRIHERCSEFLTEKQMRKFIDEDLKKEINRGVQTFQYQVLCHQSSNGQTPFVSVNLCLAEAMTKQEQKDLAMIIEEVLRQRTEGVKDRKGRIISPLFPKLLYWICDGLNVEETDPYYYLNELAVDCVVKRMQPDILSEKKCREVKEGQIIPCMGSLSGDAIVSIKIGDIEYNNIEIQKAFNLIGEYIKKANDDFFSTCERDKNGYAIKPKNSLRGVCGVYKLTHLPSGKFYVGSSKNLGRRKSEHLHSMKKKGTLGDNYFVNDFDTNNLKFEVLETCNADNLLEVEYKYTNYKDDNCVNVKDCRRYGNVDFNGNVHMVHGRCIPIMNNRGYTYVHSVNSEDVFVKSKNEWIPIRNIFKNDPKKSHFDMYEIVFENKGSIKKIKCTQDHPLHTQNGRVEAQCLTTDDYLYDAETYEHCKILSVEKINDECVTYDFTVDNDLFDVNGIISHNCRSFLTPYWQKKTYVEKDEKIQHAELYSILNYGINWEILDKANKNYICRSLEPKSIKELWNTLHELKSDFPKHIIDNKIIQFNLDDWKVVYNYLGNTARIQSISYNKETDEYSIEVLEPKTYGRWNQGVVTINIPYVALKSKLDNRDFYETLDEYLAICRKGLQERHKSIKRIRAENAPILWMDGGLARLNPQDNLDSMLEDNVDYTTISLGYVGLYETCMCLIGKSNTTKEGIKLSKEIMKYMNEKCTEWKKEDKIPYSIYSTPEEASTEKFAKSLKKLADGETIEGVTDHDYVTNSYHVNPAEKIDAFSKLKLEGEYLALSKGGAVSYVECGTSLVTNKKAILQLMKYMYDNILYSELNFRNEGSCDECGYEGELNIINDKGKLIFQCPHCLNKNQKKLHYILRLCGYIGEATNGISENSPNSNQGRISDFQARIIHIGD